MNRLYFSGQVCLTLLAEGRHAISNTAFVAALRELGLDPSTAREVEYGFPGTDSLTGREGMCASWMVRPYED